ncbi:MAG: FHA domain-containing protein [Pirellulales bacterium]
MLAAEVDKPFARLGSHTDAELVLPESRFPPVSLYLHGAGERIYCLALQSPHTAGPLPSGWLARRKFARLGKYRVMADLDDAPLPAGRPADPLGAAPRMLVEKDRGRRPATARLASPLTLVGRGARCRIRLSHPTVATYHCVLFWDGQCLWAVNLLSANGTRLNGRWIDSSRVLPGETLSLGEVRLTYLDENPTVVVPVEGGAAAARLIWPLPGCDNGRPSNGEGDGNTSPPAVTVPSPVERQPDTADLQRQIKELDARLAAEREEQERRRLEQEEQHAAEIEQLIRRAAELAEQLRASRAPAADPPALHRHVRQSRQERARGDELLRELASLRQSLSRLQQEDGLVRGERDALAGQVEQLSRRLADLEALPSASTRQAADAAGREQGLRDQLGQAISENQELQRQARREEAERAEAGRREHEYLRLRSAADELEQRCRELDERCRRLARLARRRRARAADAAHRGQPGGPAAVPIGQPPDDDCSLARLVYSQPRFDSKVRRRMILYTITWSAALLALIVAAGLVWL